MTGPRTESVPFAPGHRCYRRDGTPYSDVREWATDFEAGENRIVCQERLWHGGFLSTVFLGLNHAWEPGARPLVFESMLFAPRWGRRFAPDLDQRRYTTEAEAVAGHAAMKRYWSWRPFAVWFARSA